LAKKLLYCASNNRHLLHFHVPYIKIIEDMGITVDILSKGEAIDFPNNNFFNVNFQKSILSLKNIKVATAIRKHLKKEQYDFIYLNTSLTAALVRLAIPLKLIKKTKVINLCHGYFFGKGVPKKKNTMYLLIEKVLRRRTDHIITMNGEDDDYAKTEKLCMSKSYFVHGMGLDSGRYSYNAVVSKGDTINLLYVAEHSERKNHVELLYAMQHAVIRGADLELYLAGDGKLMEENEKTAKRLNIKDRVHFLGYLSDIENLYKKCDFSVSPSKIEGLPFTIMESLASGLPCVVSDVKGNRDLIDATNGFTYKLGEVDDLADILLSLDKLTESYKTMKKSASESIFKNTIEQTSIAFKKIFDEIFE